MSNLKNNNLVISLLSVLLGLLLGFIIMLAFGYNPISGYVSLIQGAFGTPFYIGETLRQATPLIIVGLGFSVANTAGFFNIGVAGQLQAGWISSVIVALLTDSMPSVITLPLSILAGVLAGALWAGIAGYLRAQFNVSEVIVTIMLNHTMLHISNFLVNNVLTDTAGTTRKIAPNASLRMGWLTKMTNNATIHAGFFLAIIVTIIVWYLMTKTTLGFELKTVGKNPYAAEYSGMNAKKNIVLAMLISGGLAGLAGATEGLGTFQNVFVVGGIPGTGFDGMAVALLGGTSPLGIFASGVLFGALKIGGLTMPSLSGVPNEIVDIVIASIIFFVGANYIIKLFLSKLAANKAKGVA